MKNFVKEYSLNILLPLKLGIYTVDIVEEFGVWFNMFHFVNVDRFSSS
jgi:hypothetical protein